MPRSYFGVQPLSSKQSFPQWGFGTGKSDALLPLMPNHLPGPGQYPCSSQTPNLNYPHKAFLAWSKLAQAESAAVPAHQAVPGPTRYTTCTAHTMGRVFPTARLRTAPRFSWSRTSTRESRSSMYLSRGHEREAYGSHSPGPHPVGRECFSSVGAQASSQKPTSARFAMPKTPRFMRFKACDTSHTPGPGSYEI